MKRAKIISAVLATSGAWILIISGGLFIASKLLVIHNPSKLVTVYKTSTQVKIGDILTSSNVTASRVPSTEVANDAVTDIEYLKDKKAIITLGSNEQITKSRIASSVIDVKDGYSYYTISTSVQSLNANSINTLDTVSIRVKYSDGKKPSDVIVPSIAIYEIKSASGISSDSSSQTTPAYANFLVPEEYIKLLDDASKRGELYFTKLVDSSSSPKATYVPSWNDPSYVAD